MEEELVSVTDKEFQIVGVFLFYVENCFILCLLISCECGFVEYGLRWLAKAYFNAVIAKSLSNSHANMQEKLHL